MRKKLGSQKGETLVEVMVSLLIVIMIISMLPMALETAARINAQVKKMDTVCQRTMEDLQHRGQLSCGSGRPGVSGKRLHILCRKVTGVSRTYEKSF